MNGAVGNSGSAESAMMQGVEVSELHPSEVPAAVSLWEACGLTRPWNDPVLDVERALTGETSTILAGRSATGDLIGTVMVGVDGHRGWVYYLAVSPNVQRRGCGRTLMRAAEAWLKERGAPKAQLMIRSSNTAVAGFYTALGYSDQETVVLGRFLDPELERMKQELSGHP